MDTFNKVSITNDVGGSESGEDERTNRETVKYLVKEDIGIKK